MRTLRAVSAILFSLFAATSAFAAENFDDPFDSHITAWMEGTVSAVDADKGTFTVNGKPMTYATIHAQMRGEIETESAPLGPAERADREKAIREKWKARLATAKAQSSATDPKPADVQFVSVSSHLAVVTEGMVKGVDYLELDKGVLEAQRPDKDPVDVKVGEHTERIDGKPEFPAQDVSFPGIPSESERRAMETPVAIPVSKMSMRDLAVGDHVLIGYVASEPGPGPHQALALVMKHK